MLKQIVFDHHGEVRSGWRMLVFVSLSILLGTLLKISLVAVLPDNEFVPGLANLAALVAATFAMTRLVNHKPFGAAGLTFHPAMFREFGLGILIGTSLVLSVVLVEVLCGFVSIAWRGLSVWAAIQVVFTSIGFLALSAMMEEVAFRGYLFQTLIQAITFLPATILMSALFALVHRLNPAVTKLALVNIGMAGVWFSIAYMKTRSLWLPFGLHWGWNFSETTLFGYPTSGFDNAQHRLTDAVQHGPAWITGGSFGPEGGVLATVFLIVGTAVILKSRILNAPEGMITLDSLEDILGPTVGSGRAGR